MENKKNDNQQPTVASAHHPFYLGEMKKGMFACWTVINARHYSEAIRGMDSWFAASNDDFGMPAWKPVIKIDYLFAYPQKGWRVISTQTVQSLLSDHLPIITELEYVKEASKKKY